MVSLLGGAQLGCPAGHVLRRVLLTLALLVTRSDATSPPGSAPGSPQAVERTLSPYDFRQEEGHAIPGPTASPEHSSYDHYYSKKEDLGTDPSTWKMLPIQIPDDLVSDASPQVEVTISSAVPPFPISATPQFGRHPGATEPTPHYRREALHATDSDHKVPQPQRHVWDRHDTEDNQGNFKPQQQDREYLQGTTPVVQAYIWDRHDTEHPHEGSVKGHRDSEGVHEGPAPQHHNWDHHEREDNRENPAPLPQNWDHHQSESVQEGPAPQHHNWDHHESEGNRESAPQPHNWDHHRSEGMHESPAPQHHNWDHHESEDSRVSPAPQHHNWDHHESESEGVHGGPPPQQHNWDHHESESNHGSPAPHHHNWDRHDIDSSYGSPQQQHKRNRLGTKHSAHRVPQPLEVQYYNWTHTNDGYDVRNYHAEESLIPESHAAYPNPDYLQNPMLPRPSAWNRKPPDAPSWQQNLVERLGQHLPKLPALPKLRLPGLGNFPRLPRLPSWVFGERSHRVQGQNTQEVEGEYVHKFYPLTSENNPLEHLQNNLDGYHRPHYKYPPHQDHDNQDDSLGHYQNTDNFAEHHDQHPPVTGGGIYTANVYVHQSPTEPTLHQDIQDLVHQNTSTRDYSQVGKQETQASHYSPQYPHSTRPNRRRPFHSHARPHRILKVPQRQAEEGYMEKHQNSPLWTWKTQQHPPKATHHPQRDPYNRWPSPAHNWVPQWESGPSGGYAVSSNSTTRQDHRYPPHTHSPSAQRPYGSSHQQQQGLGSSWNAGAQHQQGLSDVFKLEAYDNILDPLSSLLSRPSPLSIIGSFPYQQSIIDRITGVSPSPTTSLSIPGALLVLGLALALFYFNFVWYPTPVVTAKIFKMLSESTPDGTLSKGQQRAVGEVYQVFQSLEKEYKHDPSTSCRSRLVCQVHQEFPGLWSVTQAYTALVKSSLASVPEGYNFSGYEEAARHGSRGEDCAAKYKECALPAAPVKATLRKLLAFLSAA